MFTGHAAKSGASLVVGIDIEEAALSTARYFAEKQGIADTCLFLAGNQSFAFSSQTCFE